MDISFDPAKNIRNLATHGVSLNRAEEFDWSRALILEDTRKDYGEQRFRALGHIDERLHMLVFTPRSGRVHVISLRNANQREIRQHAKQAQPQTPANGS